MLDFNVESKAVIANNIKVGWWSTTKPNCIHAKLQLVSTEIAEATMGHRQSYPDEHLPHRSMFEVELADALIRMLEIGGGLGLVYSERATLGLLYEDVFNPEWNTPRKLLLMNNIIVDMGRLYTRHLDGKCTINVLNGPYSDFIMMIMLFEDYFNLDMEGAVREKLIYNKTRPDHQPEARNGKFGKDY